MNLTLKQQLEAVKAEAQVHVDADPEAFTAIKGSAFVDMLDDLIAANELIDKQQQALKQILDYPAVIPLSPAIKGMKSIALKALS